jgi:hypothetical protein
MALDTLTDQARAVAGAKPPRISFELGALAKPLAEQFSAQGLINIGPTSLAKWQQAADAVVALRFADILTWSQAQKAYDRLGKQILSALERGNCTQ